MPILKEAIFKDQAKTASACNIFITKSGAQAPRGRAISLSDSHSSRVLWLRVSASDLLQGMTLLLALPLPLGMLSLGYSRATLSERASVRHERCA
eukprot:3950702-Amphidinium_carterae.1